MGQTREPPDRTYHVPVMTTEVVDLMRPLDGGLIVDATFGGGGHTAALMSGLPKSRFIAIDRDPDAARLAPDDSRVTFLPGRISEIESLLSGAGAAAPAGFLFDLGVSSHQLDASERGFSYRNDGPLDMRMDPSQDISAADIVNTWPEAELTEVIRRYGEEPHARRVARAIVAARPLRTTAELASVVADAVPAAARRRRHPARRTFQAIRIAVNDELTEIATGLDAALDAVSPRGRVLVITYHSLEDRIVSARFSRGTRGCTCPPDLPVCVCGRTAELRSLTRRGVTPSAKEIASNPRARSARLRAVERLAA